jgi:5-formaminoimidazole-4-carboxamide-1-beta-D-ribofuranosyl 5'-monophosphate synthetase
VRHSAVVDIIGRHRRCPANLSDKGRNLPFEQIRTVNLDVMRAAFGDHPAAARRKLFQVLMHLALRGWGRPLENW